MKYVLRPLQPTGNGFNALFAVLGVVLALGLARSSILNTMGISSLG
jgi:hypothetical protein